MSAKSIDTILVTTVGSGGANNLIRGIRASKYGDATIVGTDADEVLIRKSHADHDYVVPYGNDPEYVDAINRVIDRHDVDVFIPQHETEIRRVARERAAIDASVVLPEEEVVTLLLDKYELPRHLRDQGFPVPETVHLADTSIDAAFERLGGGPVWCRLRYGSSGPEARPVETPTQARSWIDYCIETHGYDRDEFTLSEFLPGADYQVCTLWDGGELVLGKGMERQRYFFDLQHTGAATPLVAQLIDDPDLYAKCERILDEIAPDATGNFGFDFKETADGTPKLTEINVGKFVMAADIVYHTGEYNWAELFLDMHAGDRPRLTDPWGDIETDKFLVRGVDLEPDVVSKHDIETTPTG